MCDIASRRCRRSPLARQAEGEFRSGRTPGHSHLHQSGPTGLLGRSPIVLSFQSAGPRGGAPAAATRDLRVCAEGVWLSQKVAATTAQRGLRTWTRRGYESESATHLVVVRVHLLPVLLPRTIGVRGREWIEARKRILYVPNTDTI